VSLTTLDGYVGGVILILSLELYIKLSVSWKQHEQAIVERFQGVKMASKLGQNFIKKRFKKNRFLENKFSAALDTQDRSGTVV